MNKRSQKLCKPAFLFLILFWGGLESVQAQYFWNTDFEYGVYKSQPRKWAIEGEGEKFTAYLDSAVSKSGNKSLFMSLTNAETYTILTIPGELISGKTFSIRGSIKAQQADSLQLQLIIFDPAEGNVLASANQEVIPNNWQVASLKTSLKEGYKTDNVLIALVASGSGSFWFDSVQIKIGGKVFGEDSPDFREPTEDEIALLNERAIPFAMNNQEQQKRSELVGLSEIVEGARLVALGENSHGSSSIYKLKLRMLQYLVEKEGFSVFALEMPAIEAEYINDYVQNGRGDIDQVLTKLTYPSWQTQEMIDIVEWMKHYNEQHNNSVEFRGYDMQNGWSALGAVKEFAASHDSVALAELEVISDLYEKSLEMRQIKDSLVEKSEAMLRYLSQKSFDGVSLDRVETINHYMNIFMQSLAFHFQLEQAKSRDEYMAENIRWIVENTPETSRMIISADNTHITKTGGKTGAFLNRWYGKDYVSFGFTYKTGTYSAYGPKSFYEVHPPYIGTYEYFFSKSKHENFLLDLRQVKNIPLLNQRAGFRSIGSRPQEVTQFYEIDIKKHFDVVVYLETSSHTSYLKEN
ncbi:erythromycin esterase family protein [Gracilimonas sp.]|uniref:erythromycin esterase family protein n=1 Tax=Gracilimonas sp. TaxID=1974203 RepID=UPI0032EE15BD